MELLTLLQENQTVAIVFFTTLGLLVGSFLNVVIHRTPLKMYKAWREDSVNFLIEQEDIGTERMLPISAIVEKDTPITLSKPASRCPNCGHQIRWFENIPVISWLVLLRGKCASCKTPISFRYPFVEITTAILSGLLVVTFGVTLQLAFSLVFLWTLIALTGIDFDTQLLPDNLTMPLAGLGLIANTMGLFVSPVMSVWGLVIGYLCLYLVSKLFELVMKKQGMGHGDFKLLAALGAWMGPAMLPLIVLLSSVVGSIIGIGYMLKNNGKSMPFAFGPYLAIAGFIAFLYGQDIVSWYLGMYK